MKVTASSDKGSEDDSAPVERLLERLGNTSSISSVAVLLSDNEVTTRLPFNNSDLAENKGKTVLVNSDEIISTLKATKKEGLGATTSALSVMLSENRRNEHDTITSIYDYSKRITNNAPSMGNAETFQYGDNNSQKRLGAPVVTLQEVSTPVDAVVQNPPKQNTMTSSTSSTESTLANYSPQGSAVLKKEITYSNIRTLGANSLPQDTVSSGGTKESSTERKRSQPMRSRKLKETASALLSNKRSFDVPTTASVHSDIRSMVRITATGDESTTEVVKGEARKEETIEKFTVKPRGSRRKDSTNFYSSRLEGRLASQRRPEAETGRSSVCSKDPCGPGIACSPTTDSDFICLCSDGSQIQPNQKCPSLTPVDVVPSAISLPHFIEQQHKTPKELLFGVFVSTSLLLVLLLSVVFWRRRALCSLLRQQKEAFKGAKQSAGGVAKTSVQQIYNFASNPNYYTTSTPDSIPLNDLCVQLISVEQIRFICEVGEGNFGKVYKGLFGPNIGYAEDGNDEEDACTENYTLDDTSEKSNEDANGSRVVAIKVLKEIQGREAEGEFHREVEIMSSFRHQNIVTLIGIVAPESLGSPWMVFEFMPFGDLAEYLRKFDSENLGNRLHRNTPTQEDLLNMGMQIASGMSYLSCQRFVHRDLACRNCLVGENLTIKISDFGMSRDVYSCDYYKVGGSRMLPVRWMAPESILYGKFTLQSDVWSYGVVLWEIYSLGVQPYFGNTNEEVVKLIKHGILLCPPESCPAQVRDIMRSCWSTDPHDRTNFQEIYHKLQMIQTQDLCPEGGNEEKLNYSELCSYDSSGIVLDVDQYLVPTSPDRREYLTVLSEA